MINFLYFFFFFITIPHLEIYYTIFFLTAIVFHFQGKILTLISLISLCFTFPLYSSFPGNTPYIFSLIYLLHRNLSSMVHFFSFSSIGFFRFSTFSVSVVVVVVMVVLYSLSGTSNGRRIINHFIWSKVVFFWGRN